MGADHSFFDWFRAGGWVMWPLLVFSLLTWGVIFERILRVRKLQTLSRSFHLEILNALLRADWPAVHALCKANPELPQAGLIQFAIARRDSKEPKLRAQWKEAVERKRLWVNQDLRKGLWLLGTIATASPFVGLFGTVLGILKSFREMAVTGKGGFTVVASGISESLVATAGGILVAIIASMAFNALTTRIQVMILQVRLEIEEVLEHMELGA